MSNPHGSSPWRLLSRQFVPANETLPSNRAPTSSNNVSPGKTALSALRASPLGACAPRSHVLTVREVTPSLSASSRWLRSLLSRNALMFSNLFFFFDIGRIPWKCCRLQAAELTGPGYIAKLLILKPEPVACVGFLR